MSISINTLSQQSTIGNVVIYDDNITTISGDIIIAPTGTGTIVTGDTQTSRVYNGSDATCDLGSNSNQYKDLYLSGTVNATVVSLQGLTFPPTIPVTGMIIFDNVDGMLKLFDGVDWLSITLGAPPPHSASYHYNDE